MDLTTKEQQAAIAIAEGNLTLPQIANMTRIPNHELRALLTSPTFQSLVHEYQAAFRAEIELLGATNRIHRIQRIRHRLAQLDRIVAERASAASQPPIPDPTLPDANGLAQFHDPEALTVPGASTGLFTRTLKSVGTGLQQRIFPEYTLDTELIKAIERTEDKLAEEMGQRTQKQELTIIPKAYVGVKIDDL